MATREETDKIRALLQQQANQRVNPFMKGLSMLTGGIAGEFTGTNEDIRNRNYAKRALMEEDLKSLNEERLGSRMEAERQQRLQDEIKLIAARDKAASETRAKEASEKREAQRPSLVGELRARPNYQLGGSMAMPIPALEPIESLEEQAAYEKAQKGTEDEERKRKSGYISLGPIGGTPDQLKDIAANYPEYKALIDNALKKAVTDEPKVVSTQDPMTGQRMERIEFPRSYTREMRKAYYESLGEDENKAFDDEPAATGAKKTEATKPTDIKGFTVRRISK
jgi:hypothetical protein